MDPITLVVLALGALAVIAIIALIARRTGSTTPTNDIRLEVGGTIFHFSQDQWQHVYGHLTADDLADVEQLNAARDNLRAAERSGDATQVAHAAREFNACFERVNAAYARATLAWLRTSHGQHYLSLRRLPQKPQ